MENLGLSNHKGEEVIIKMLEIMEVRDDNQIENKGNGEEDGIMKTIYEGFKYEPLGFRGKDKKAYMREFIRKEKVDMCLQKTN